MPDLTLLRALFDGLEEGVVYLSGDVVEYENQTAAALLAGGVPDEVRRGGAQTLLAGGRLFDLRETLWDGGRLIILTPRLSEAAVERRMPMLTEDLRRQVGNLSAVTQLLISSGRRDGGEKQRDYLAIMNQSFYRLLRLIQSAELACDMAAGRVKYSPGALDLGGLCRELSEQVEGLSPELGVTFSWEGTDTLLLTGDAALLRQMILELLSNALRGAGAGGKAGLRLTKNGERAILTVWNSGEGMDLSELEREDYNPQPTGGLRLGLSAVRHIAALHGGTVMLESRPGEGARVTVSLNAAPPEQGAVNTPQSDPTGGFSPVLVALSGVLPFSAFRPEDLE